jgi:hypothetical protein
MSSRIPCVHCEQLGFVRREYVIQGGEAATEYYCGRCEHGWVVREHERSPRAASSKAHTPRRQRDVWVAPLTMLNRRAVGALYHQTLRTAGPYGIAASAETAWH